MPWEGSAQQLSLPALLSEGREFHGGAAKENGREKVPIRRHKALLFPDQRNKTARKHVSKPGGNAVFYDDPVSLARGRFSNLYVILSDAIPPEV